MCVADSTALHGPGGVGTAWRICAIRKSETAATATVLEFYRARWQVELAFKRLKSLLGLSRLKKYDPIAARAWIAAKLLVALLIEEMLNAAEHFSPWGHTLAPAGTNRAQSVAGNFAHG